MENKIKGTDKIRFVPQKRTAIDGRNWWLVYDRENGEYSTWTCFGIYKSKHLCQLAIDYQLSHNEYIQKYY